MDAKLQKFFLIVEISCEETAWLSMLNQDQEIEKSHEALNVSS